MKETKKETLREPDLFKEIVNGVRSILTMIATERDINIKSLIMQTEMTLENIDNPYYEAFNIIFSVKRILYDSKKLRKDSSFTKTLYKELDTIYKLIKFTTEKIWCDYTYTDCSTSCLDLRNRNLNFKSKDGKTAEDLFDRMNFTRISSVFLDSVFPAVKDTSVFVEAHKNGFKSSRKCIEEEFLFDIREGSKEFCDEKTLRYLKSYLTKQSSTTNVELKKFMDTQFSCDKTAAKVVAMLFHYLSEIKGKNTRYEIILKENNKYRIKWTYPMKPSLKAIKKYLMAQEMQDLYSIKKFNGFGPVGIYKTDYYTIKSNDNKNEGIETRLIVLSCGHQLGFDLIDKFLKKYYMNYSVCLQCPSCRRFISILGCYDAIVYKCNESSSFCAII